MMCAAYAPRAAQPAAYSSLNLGRAMWKALTVTTNTNNTNTNTIPSHSATRISTTTRVFSSSSSSSSSSCGFAELGLSGVLVEKVSHLGITAPTPIQKEATRVLLRGENAAIEGHTGSGKTLAYLLPVLEQLQLIQDEIKEQGEKKGGGGGGKGGVRALVIVPSQELAMQICRVAQSLLSDKTVVQQCIGGANKKRQVAAIKKNCPQIIVGTPGRLADLSQAGHLQTHYTEKLVLDEADKLLNDNYAKDLQRLQAHVGKKAERHQRILCSATLSAATAKKFVDKGWISSRFTHVAVGKKAAEQSLGEEGEKNGEAELRELERDEVAIPELPPHLDHCWVPTAKPRKADMVRKCINALNPNKVLVFHNFSNQLVQTAAKLSTGAIKTGILDGKMNKDAKRRVIQSFNRGDIRALIASEAATRGLDFPGCDCVVNMDMPMDVQHYVHRAGRTGRGNTRGVVITVPSGKEIHVIKKYAKKLKVSIPEYKVTHGELVDASAWEKEDEQDDA